MFAKITAGQIVIEPRLNDPAHKRLKIGDLILFINRDSREERLVKVVGLLRFDSFVELFHAYPPERFGGEGEQQLLHDVRKVYSQQREAEHGVLGIKVHVLRRVG